MKVVLAGGTGQVGAVLERAMTAAGHEVVVLTRNPVREHHVGWDARTPGPWTAEIDGSDVVVNLAGRSVSCRYTEANLRDMMDSRVQSAEAVGAAIAAAAKPPALWLQMSTATIYAHRHDAPHDEATGVIGGTETGVPDYWEYSVRIAKNWERAQQDADTPHTRKVALRAAMVMSPDRGGVFDVLLRMTRLGLGGPVAGGAQYLSWIHDQDFVRAVEFLIARDDITGPVNLAAPGPLPHRAFMRALRAAAGVRWGLPATRWMAEIGAFVIRTDTELLLKSRRVIPGRLLEEGFVFEHAAWPDAATDLVRRRARARAGS
ncbi:TIGR01777 family oxidoreductase [Streptomyces sp. NPDC055099]